MSNLNPSKGRFADRIGGGVAMLLGGVAVYESYRIYPLRISTFVGDYVMPLVLGVLLFVTGFILVLRSKASHDISFPTGKERRALLATLILMFVYCCLIPVLGYTLSTFLVLIGLFRVIGTYRWHITLLCAVLTTASLYLFFILGLDMSFPTG